MAHVEDVIDEFVSLKKRGANMIGLCPFHNEKTPSFTVSPAKNIYKCFGCGRGGNAVSFVMEHENYSFPESIRYLAKKYGIQLEETIANEEDKEKAQEKESFFIINEFAKVFFHQQLLTTDEGKSIGLSYFKNRGLLLSTITEFNLGYSPMNSIALLEAASKNGYKDEFLEKLGLKSKSNLDFFRSRIIFPITNLSGKIVAFGGRTLSKDKKIPKYINSPESDIYNKSKSLYGLFQAKNQIRREDNCYLVEGYTDVLNLSQNDVKNVVASSGTALTEGQLRIIKRFTSLITFLYDGDSAGQKAALRGLPLALDQGLDVRIVPLPNDQDPDSLIAEMGASKFQEFLIDSTQDFIIYRTKFIQEKYKDLPIEKSTAIKEIFNVLAHLKDSIKRSIYVKEICNLLGLDEKSANAELNKSIRKLLSNQRRARPITPDRVKEETNLVASKENSPQTTFQKTDYYQEKDLVRILIQDGHKFLGDNKKYKVSDFIFENINNVLDIFENDVFKKIIIEYKNQKSPGLEYFISHNDKEIRSIAIEFAESPYVYANWSKKGIELQTQKNKDENFEKDSQQAVLRFSLNKLKIKKLEIFNMLSNSNSNDEKINALLKTYYKILNHQKEIVSELGAILLNEYPTSI